MRKILLGTTAVVGAALMAPTIAAAQEAPTVRIGGYFRFNYAFVDSDGQNNARTATGVINPGGADTGKSDFQSDTEVHVIVSGKAANGLTYGATVELQIDARNDAATTGSKTFVDTDEMYMFLAHPRFGQIRVGDEDGPVLGLMTAGHITNFGTGGVDGDYGDFVFKAVLPGNFFPAGSLNDSTKIIYLSPQFFGFDFGASFAFNQGEGEDVGCVTGVPGAACDRTVAVAGANPLRRRNELQLAARWRGSFGGVGIAVAGGGVFADPTKSVALGIVAPAEQVRVGYVGAQVSAYGLLVGGTYMWGQSNNSGVPLLRATAGTGVVDDSEFSQWFLGASYTVGAFTVGANYYRTESAGNQFLLAERTEQAVSVGATYRLAPGLELVAEWVNFSRKENGFDFLAGGPGPFNNKVEGDVFILGSRIAF